MTQRMAPRALTPEQLDELSDILGPRGVCTDINDIEPHLSDWRNLYKGASSVMIKPASSDALAAAVKLLAAAGVPMVPQGGNTSMVGGAIPDESGSQVIVSLSRMNQIRNIDTLDMTVTAEAGVVLKTLQDAASDAGCIFPLSLASEGSATVGGILSTNAGGNATVRYGNARELMLGLEVVLPDGGIIHGLRRLRKDNAGYALRHLFAGSEGTLGIITAASLRMFPKPRTDALALCAVADEDAALSLFRRFRALDEASVRSFEYMSGQGIALVERHIDGVMQPFSQTPSHAVLIDLASSRRDDNLAGLLERVLEDALAMGEVTDAVIAQNESQRAELWRLREEQPEAQKRAGATIRNDVSVPVAKVPELIRQASAAFTLLVPKSRPAPFGHMGDGNIHMNLVQPETMTAADFLSLSSEIMDCVNAIVRNLDGSFAAEHGIGRLKVGTLESWRGGTELDVMRRVKAAIDPQGLMNPGKVFRSQQ
jgi:FAD/FMN-containing dehydrogenase